MSFKECVDESLVIHASFIDLLCLTESETARLKELHEVLIPFGLNCRVTCIGKDGERHPPEVEIVKVTEESDVCSQVLSFDEIRGATKLLRFISDYRGVLAESGDAPTAFSELLARLRAVELTTTKANLDLGARFSQICAEIDVKIDTEIKVEIEAEQGKTAEPHACEEI